MTLKDLLKNADLRGPIVHDTTSGNIGRIVDADGVDVAMTQQVVGDPTHAKRQARAALIATVLTALPEMLDALEEADRQRGIDVALQMLTDAGLITRPT